ncbi:BACON domain-containing protein [Bacteroides caecigallinarum]|uniref:BACON domain-containing protein n=1 Tax=Bacteroides caecigallinarum TaxID=1411144 RepID=UPI001F31A585|nr:BACON domain-containing protein [Bacteroides caecigallinarum]MCF2738045.1 BACON domain-containing protein [Bacteroides caecigallinarum]
MKAFYSLLLLLAVALTSCDEVLGTQDQIELADGTSTSLIFNADESGDATIKFVAEAAWTASVSEITASKSGESISWLKLSSYGGEAGEYTITVSLTKNFTGASRKAEIKIVCGESEVVITIEQKGETSTGVVAKIIKKIVYKETDNSSLDKGETPYESDFTLDFSYANDGSVARIIEDMKYSYDSERSTYTYNFNYDIVGEIQVEKKNSRYDETDNYLVKLDDRGNATEVSKNGKKLASFGYTNDVRLAKMVQYDEYNDDEVDYQDIFTYDNGVFSKYTTTDNGDGENDEYIFDASYFANKYPNNGMIDMMGFIGGGFDYDFLFYIGRLAKTSDYCLEKIPGDGCYEDNISHPIETKGPNQYIKTVTGKSADYSDEPTPVEYKFDEDKNLTEVKIIYPYKINEYSYEVWTTDKYEERPEWNEELQQEVMVKYYFTTTKNHKSEYVKSGNDYYTYTISY